MYQRLVAALGWWFLLAVVQAQAAGEATAPGDGSWALDEMPTTAGEWGGLPLDSEDSAVNPPAFVWRPRKDAAGYGLQTSADSDFKRPCTRVDG